jgi:ketosteroid isomerase-like protein
MPRPLVIALLMLFALARPAVAQPADAEAVVAAERAFAADALATGLDASFLKWSTEDAVMIADGGARLAREVLNPHARFDRNAPSLVWWPNWAGISKSGDLGFTTGPVEVGGVRSGHYFTIWERQADGGWKWVYDGGVAADAVEAPGPEIAPDILPTSVLFSASPDAAMSEVRTVEAVLAASALRDQRQAHLSLLAPDGRLYAAPLAPAIGAEQFATTLGAWPHALELSPPFGGGASDAGDMVWTYGRALWTEDDAPGAGHYVHVWQKRTRGWVLVFAQIITDPPRRVSNVAPPPAPH